jgi:hypothetical protein
MLSVKQVVQVLPQEQPQFFLVTEAIAILEVVDTDHMQRLKPLETTARTMEEEVEVLVTVLALTMLLVGLERLEL